MFGCLLGYCIGLIVFWCLAVVALAWGFGFTNCCSRCGDYLFPGCFGISVGWVFRLGLTSATFVLLFGCIVALGWCLLYVGLFGLAVFVI